ncbi:MAG: nuclear transport factor 2 family protein [Dehalococcoidia bacterium]|nr:nuclear transport factor 2 family protein [Dehalococcoidia bacterium]
MYGSTAVVNGTNTMGTGPRGGERSFRIRFIDVYVKRRGRWQMVAWQATQIAQG